MKNKNNTGLEEFGLNDFFRSFPSPFYPQGIENIKVQGYVAQKGPNGPGLKGLKESLEEELRDYYSQRGVTKKHLKLGKNLGKENLIKEIDNFEGLTLYTGAACHTYEVVGNASYGKLFEGCITLEHGCWGYLFDQKYLDQYLSEGCLDFQKLSSEAESPFLVEFAKYFFNRERPLFYNKTVSEYTTKDILRSVRNVVLTRFEALSYFLGEELYGKFRDDRVE